MLRAGRANSGRLHSIFVLTACWRCTDGIGLPHQHTPIWCAPWGSRHAAAIDLQRTAPAMAPARWKADLLRRTTARKRGSARAASTLRHAYVPRCTAPAIPQLTLWISANRPRKSEYAGRLVALSRRGKMSQATMTAAD